MATNGSPTGTSGVSDPAGPGQLGERALSRDLALGEEPISGPQLSRQAVLGEKQSPDPGSNFGELPGASCPSPPPA